MPMGGANSYQAIKELEKKERIYELALNKDSLKISWQPKNIEQGNSLSFANVPILRASSIVGKDIVLPYHSGFNFSDFLIDIFEVNGGYDCIVELGCGYGRNLFEIFYKGGSRDVPYYGGEFTKSGVDIASKLAQATPNMNATFFHFNHLEPDLQIIKEKGYKRAFVFTSHSIEQVKYMPQSWFDVVSNISDHVRCIHLEPYGFQSKILGSVTQKHEEFMLTQGWNLNFLEELQNAVKIKKIVLDDTVLEIGCAHDPYNPGSIACWHSDKIKI